MAKAGISVYNVYILKHSLPAKSLAPLSLVIGVLLGVILLSVNDISAQSLQGAGGKLQQQTAPDQNSLNTQSQTGTLQNNNSSSVLNKAARKPLGVVSQPNQIVPDVVAEPSNTLKTEVSTPEDSNALPVILAVGSLAIALAGIYILRRKQPQPPAKNVSHDENIDTPKEVKTEEPVATPDPLPVSNPPKEKPKAKKSSKKSRRQRRKQQAHGR